MFSTVAAGAKPENNMQAPNYKIQGPIANHTQQPSAFQKAATTAGANVLGKAGEAALFGMPAAQGAAANTAIPGILPSLAAKGAAAGGGMAGLGAMAIGLGTDAIKNKMKKAKHQKMLKKYPGARIDKKTKVQKIGP